MQHGPHTHNLMTKAYAGGGGVDLIQRAMHNAIPNPVQAAKAAIGTAAGFAVPKLASNFAKEHTKKLLDYLNTKDQADSKKEELERPNPIHEGMKQVAQTIHDYAPTVAGMAAAHHAKNLLKRFIPRE